MRRRNLLTAGVASVLAGCTWAYDGGALRDERSLVSLEDPARSGRAGDDFVTARSGRQWMRDADGNMDLRVGTRVWRVTRAGDVVWRYNYFEESLAAAMDERVFLLDADRRLVASERAEVGKSSTSIFDVESTVDWSVTFAGRATPPIAASGESAFVTLENPSELAGVRDGELIWQTSLPDEPTWLRPLATGVLVGTPTAVIAIDLMGARDWLHHTSHEASVDIGDGRVAIRDHQEVTLCDLTSGRRLWSVPLDEPRGPPTISADAVYVADLDGIHSLELETGERRWRVSAGHYPIPRLIDAPEGVYSSLASGVVVAIDREGVRWRRDLDREKNHRPVDGWLEDETVAVLYADGRVFLLQRHTEGRPLLW